MTDLDYMKLAIEEARDGIRKRHGGPFGSIIVKDGKIVGKGHNRVLRNNDPTCHGEIAAIRNACDNLDTFDLTGCTIYTTGEPCHMCLGAGRGAKLGKMFYGCTIEDNGRIGFRDDKFDNIFGGRDKLKGYMQMLDRDACLQLFDKYRSMQHRTY